MNFLSIRFGLNLVMLFSVTTNVWWMYNYSSWLDSYVYKNSSFSSNHTNFTESLNLKPLNYYNKSKESDLQPCGKPAALMGYLHINLDELKAAFDNLYSEHYLNQSIFQPHHCAPNVTVAIIIPFRHREYQLQVLLSHLHPILMRQLLRFQIFVVEQAGNTTFNKGRLMNSGFQFIRKIFGDHFDCFIFHDVDMLPKNDKNIYKCGLGENANVVYHLACSLNKFKYKPLCCGMTVGGVLSFSEQQFIKVNGYPNDYWGWGGEDDDMDERIKIKKLLVLRPLSHLCRYFMIEHDKDRLNNYIPEEVNARVKYTKLVIDADGLNNLNTTILSYERQPLYVHVLVDVGRQEDSIPFDVYKKKETT